MSGPSEERAFLSLGGNIGDPAKAMGSALRILDADANVTVSTVSALYRTPPWGRLDQPDFLNAAAEIRTSLTPRALLDLCLEAERTLKRVREERWGPRIVDIDLLMFGDRSIRETGLEVPHPRMLERAFVLVPLAEIASDAALDGISAADRLRALDISGITRMAGDADWWKS